MIYLLILLAGVVIGATLMTRYQPPDFYSEEHSRLENLCDSLRYEANVAEARRFEAEGNFRAQTEKVNSLQQACRLKEAAIRLLINECDRLDLHENGCPEDNTCECPKVRQIRRAYLAPDCLLHR
jgi:hypothetical protein